MLGNDIPELASPPSRQISSQYKSKVGKTDENLNDSLLRRPSSDQHIKAVSPITVDNIRRPDAQYMAGLEQATVDQDMLRRPSSRGKRDDYKQFTSLSSESEYSDSMKASRLEFQRLLDDSSSTPKTNIAGSHVRKSAPEGENNFDNSLRSMNRDDAFPNLASRPSRHRGSIGTFIQPVLMNNKSKQSSLQTPVNENLDDSLLRKPELQVTDADASSSPSSVQAKDIVHITEGSKPSKPSESKVQSNLDQVLIVPELAAPPSRHRGSIGTFVQPSSTQVNGNPSYMDEVGAHVDESLLRKPNFVREGLDHMNSIHATDATVAPTVPLMETFPVNIDDIGRKEQGGIDHEAETKASQMKSQAEGLLQESFTFEAARRGSDIMTEHSDSGGHPEAVQEANQLGQFQMEDLIGEINLKEEFNGPSAMSETQNLNTNPRSQDEKHARLKKPVRVLQSESDRRLRSESQTVSAITSLDNMQQSPDGELESNDITKKDPVRSSMENSVENSGNKQRSQVIQEHLTGMQGTGKTEGLHDESPDCSITTMDVEAESHSGLSTSDEYLRKPSRYGHVELSVHTDLQSSNLMLHQAKEEEENDWARAEAALKAREQVEVKLIGSNSAGLFVSYGCLVGFLPSFELSSRRGLADFGSWLQQNGYGSSQKKPFAQSHSVIDNMEEVKLNTGNFYEVKDKYRDYASKLMSSFVGERTKVMVKFLDKGRRKLKVSEKEADVDCGEHLQKKANLMAELKLGEVVSCQVKSITPIGVFVEIDGVPALIHHSEVSWNTRVDPASLLSVGEVVKAKVCRLDRTLQRINLSLKQMQPDPLKRTLESVVGDFGTESHMAEARSTEPLEANWPELMDLVEKLEQAEEISSVTRGRCLYSSAFAPTFQVLISTSQGDGYKLLARFENKIQEILVDTTLTRDKMKERIRVCTVSES
ncbi:hypothetical protein KP509_34G040000 [Ceratopteris richardii]|nr:hypothetical protein KP509_34G040000 [Ceratopteris richardii]